MFKKLQNLKKMLTFSIPCVLVYCLYHEAEQSNTLEQSLALKTFDEDNHWIFNWNVIQHGTIMSLRRDKVVEIEVMIRLFNVQKIRDATLRNYTNTKTVKCFIELNKKEVILWNVHQMKNLDSVQVFCLLTEQEYSRVV
jgi:hypothetical protein